MTVRRNLINVHDLIVFVRTNHLENADMAFNVGDATPYHVSEASYDEESNTIILG